MPHPGGDYEPSNHGYLFTSESEVTWDAPGGNVLAFKAAATLLIGDAVFLVPAGVFTVNKSNTVADYQNFAGIVVGGERTFRRVLQSDEDVGEQAALVNEMVLVLVDGKAKVVSDAAIAAGAKISQGAVTAGRVDDGAGAVAGQTIGNALEAAAGAAEKILALIRHR